MNTRARARSLRLPIAVLVACALLTTILEIAPTEAEAADAPTAGRAVSLAAVGAKASVRYGERLNLNGRVPSGTAGGTVRLDYAPRGGTWRHLSDTRTGAGGTYRFSLKPQSSGAFRADLRGGHLRRPCGHRGGTSRRKGPPARPCRIPGAREGTPRARLRRPQGAPPARDRAWLEDGGPHPHGPWRALPRLLALLGGGELSPAGEVRGRRSQPRRQPSAGRPGVRVPPEPRFVVRAGLLRQPDLLRRRAGLQHARRGAQVPARVAPGSRCATTAVR